MEVMSIISNRLISIKYVMSMIRSLLLLMIQQHKKRMKMNEKRKKQLRI